MDYRDIGRIGEESFRWQLCTMLVSIILLSFEFFPDELTAFLFFTRWFQNGNRRRQMESAEHSETQCSPFSEAVQQHIAGLPPSGV